MSIYSTLAITRADALSEIQRRLQGALDHELEDILLTLVGDRERASGRVHNYLIVQDYEIPHKCPDNYSPGCLE